MPLIGRRFKMGVCLEAGGRGNCSFTIYVNAVPGRSCYHLTLNVSFVISFSACQASRFDVSNFIFSRSNPCLRVLSYNTFLLLLKQTSVGNMQSPHIYVERWPNVPSP